MPRKKPIEGSISEIESAMKKSDNRAEYRRIQCVHLAILYPDMSSKEISKITLFCESHVRAIHSAYRKDGLAGLTDKRGGRYRENITFEQELELLAPFEEESPKGSLVVAGRVKQAYEAKVGKEVAESTIYRMLNRHGFRKITPYRRHKKADSRAQEVFKKTSQA
jgi:transposase